MDPRLSSRVLNYTYPANRVMHRGAGIDAPENTLEAITYGVKEHGSHAVEFDVQLSSDDIPILHHDAFMGRTVVSPGFVVDYTATELTALDAGSWHSISYVGARVPLYADIVAYCKRNEIWMNVEVKGDFKDIKQMRKIGSVVATLTKELYQEELSQNPVDYHSIPLISSFSHEALEEALIAAPEVPRALLVRGIGPTEGFVASMDELLEALERLEATCCHINQEGLVADDVDVLLKAGYSVMCYTVNNRERLLELEGFGVQSICTDNFSLDEGRELLVSRL